MLSPMTKTTPPVPKTNWQDVTYKFGLMVVWGATAGGRQLGDQEANVRRTP